MSLSTRGAILPAVRFGFLPEGEFQTEIMESLSGSSDSRLEHDSVVSGHTVQAVFSVLWSTVVMELWKRRSSTQSYRWGTLHLAERFAEPRPGFQGNIGVNPVTGRVEPLFPEWQRDLIIAAVSLPVVAVFLGAHALLARSIFSGKAAVFSRVAFPPTGLVVVGMVCFYWGEAQVQELHKDWDSLVSQTLLYVPSILHIVYTNMLATVYKTVAQALTEYGE